MYQAMEHVSPSLFVWVRVAYRLSIGWSGSAGSSILGNGIWGIGQPFLATVPMSLSHIRISFPDSSGSRDQKYSYNVLNTITKSSIPQ